MALENEYTIIMRLITRPGTPIGAGMEELLDALGLPEQTGNHMIIKHLSSLHQQIRPLGLVIRHNPIAKVFYLDTASRTEMVDEDTALPDRLAATLLVVLTLAYQEGDWVTFDRIREFRRKALRSVVEDLRELAELGYIELDRKGRTARPGSRVGFEIDYESFFRRLSSSSDERLE
jgi:hypothetical protein